MNNEIQNNEFILQGGLGECRMGDKVYDITEIKRELNKDYGFSSTTLTLRPPSDENKTEDAEFEIIQPKQLPFDRK